MNASPIVWLVPLFAIFASCYCFHISREYSRAHRVLVSAHGVLSLAVIPAALFIDTPLLAADSRVTGVGVTGTSLLALASLVYSFLKIRGSTFVTATQVLMLPAIVLFYMAGAVLVWGIH